MGKLIKKTHLYFKLCCLTLFVHHQMVYEKFCNFMAMQFICIRRYLNYFLIIEWRRAQYQWVPGGQEMSWSVYGD
jgi:hypothetical protein